MKEIIELIKSTPNDMELGKKVRDLYNQKKLVFPEEIEYTDEYYKSTLTSEIENPSM